MAGRVNGADLVAAERDRLVAAKLERRGRRGVIAGPRQPEHLRRIKALS